MPFSSTKELPKQVKKLPLKAKKIFLKAFNSAYSQGKEDSESMKIAWSTVSKIYKNVNDSWVLRSSVKTKSVINKGGLPFLRTHYFETTLTSNQKDDWGHRVSTGLLKQIPNMVEDSGDIFHLRSKGDIRFQGLYEKVQCEYDEEDNDVKLKFILNKNHPKYKIALELHKKYPELGISAEFFNPVEKDGNIVSADYIGWSVLPNPALMDTMFSS